MINKMIIQVLGWEASLSRSFNEYCMKVPKVKSQHLVLVLEPG
jgi:hypothetical protein